MASYRSSVENSVLIGGAVTLGMVAFNWKASKTLYNVWLHQNGKLVMLETFTVLGANSKLRQIEVGTMRGFGHFVHKALRIPVFRFREGERSRMVFFKQQYVGMRGVLGHRCWTKV